MRQAEISGCASELRLRRNWILEPLGVPRYRVRGSARPRRDHSRLRRFLEQVTDAREIRRIQRWLVPVQLGGCKVLISTPKRYRRLSYYPLKPGASSGSYLGVTDWA